MADADEGGLMSEVLKIDEATMKQIDRIQKEVAENSELVGDLEDLNCLVKEYASDDRVYQSKIEDLKSHYRKIRRTRGDGNCFYRAFAFAYLETLLTDKSDLKRFKEEVTKGKELLLTLGYPSFTLQDFYETFMEVVEDVEKPNMTTDQLVQTFRRQDISDYIVCYLRIVTAGSLQSNADFYMAFIDEGRTVKEYCSTEVEPMYKEVDHLHITALTSALGVHIRIMNMDRTEGHINRHEFPEGASPQIHLLYRPGHYDILYQ